MKEKPMNLMAQEPETGAGFPDSHCAPTEPVEPPKKDDDPPKT